MRMTIALMESSFANFFSCSMVASESAIIPVTGRTATFSPVCRDQSSTCERSTIRTKEATKTSATTAQPRRKGRRPLGGGRGGSRFMRLASLAVDFQFRPERFPEDRQVFRILGRPGHVRFHVPALRIVLVRAAGKGS